MMILAPWMIVRRVLKHLSFLKAQELLGEVKDQNSRADYAARILELARS